MIVFDVTAPKTLENVDNWRKGSKITPYCLSFSFFPLFNGAKAKPKTKQKKKEFIDQANIKDPENYPFVIIGNKVDQKDDRKVTTKAASSKLGDLAYFETSAKESTNVEQAFVSAVKKAIAREPEEPTFDINEVDIGKNPNAGKEDKSGGCSC